MCSKNSKTVYWTFRSANKLLLRVLNNSDDFLQTAKEEDGIKYQCSSSQLCFKHSAASCDLTELLCRTGPCICVSPPRSAGIQNVQVKVPLLPRRIALWGRAAIATPCPRPQTSPHTEGGNSSHSRSPFTSSSGSKTRQTNHLLDSTRL